MGKRQGSGKSEGWADAYPPKDTRDWANYVSRTVSHYKGRIKHWEIWNEENGVDFYRPRPDAKSYTTLLKAAFLAAKKADPECVIVLGGLQMNGIIPNPWSEVKVSNYLEDLYKAGAQPYFDVCNTHPYVLPKEGADYMMKLTRDTLSLMARYGDGNKPLWITEVGCGATSKEAEETQARLLKDTFEAAGKEPRLQRVFWYALRGCEEGPSWTRGFHGFVHLSRESKAGTASFCACNQNTSRHPTISLRRQIERRDSGKRIPGNLLTSIPPWPMFFPQGLTCVRRGRKTRGRDKCGVSRKKSQAASFSGSPPAGGSSVPG